MRIKKTDFIKSAVVINDYPETTEIEFAFIGRSNVGKSSLINSLTNRRNLARTSKTPGRTQLINFFDVNEDFYFVDLPGYGFAKVPEAVKKNWGKIIADYLNSDREKIVFLLLDIRRVPSAEDIEMLKWLEHYSINYYIIFTNKFIVKYKSMGTWQNIGAGLILGVLNFANIALYVKAHMLLKDSPAVVFAGMNVLVVMLGVLSGLFIFKERVKPIVALGLALGLSSVLCLAYAM